MSDKKLAPPPITEIQNNLIEMHDKLFPTAKNFSPDRAEMLANARSALKGTKLVQEEELKRVQEENRRFREVLNSVLADAVKCEQNDSPVQYRITDFVIDKVKKVLDKND